MTPSKSFLWALALSCLCSCFPAVAQSKETTQGLSQNIHATLDDLKEQQKVLETALTEAKTDLRSSQEQVKELQTELNDLSISSRNMSERLTDCIKKSTVLEYSRNKWRTSSLLAWGIIIAYVVMKMLKTLGKIHVPFI